ncbi:hypothetical protein KIH39_16805 [Telmatocola sphagniphila]|uniref:Uncharacterized protein n=1 Tax=Telmatocola sphagniphila TaxID=1123043 RepID=A0A8E6B317_9BACT|nr:hypothetical protein [Telmatocola sphagniphila]QVL30509.1 hypothetical protein KIH39_16805 [Telmatocola sphagniphila]
MSDPMESMNGEDWKAILALMPPDQIGQFVVVLSNGNEICLDTVVRTDVKYLVFRGRLAGQTEEGRAFFVPLSNISYLRWEKFVKIDELRTMFPDLALKASEAAKQTEIEAAPPTELLPRPPLPPLQPAGENPSPNTVNSRNNLLERIRAARASTAR